MPSYSKCYELGNVPQLSSSSIVLLYDPPLGFLKSLRACQYLRVKYLDPNYRIINPINTTSKPPNESKS